MEKLIVATSNAHKLEEFQRILGDRFQILGLKDLKCEEEIPENGDTFEANAAAKAQWVCDRYGVDCIADDSGLEVDALSGAPGVHSARYSGLAHNDAANNARLLSELASRDNRRARFRTVIAWARPGKETLFFRGTVEGEILKEASGTSGFGYDPLFRPLGWNKTFGEATPDQKNAVSHRSRAIAEFVSFLDSNNTPN